MGLTSWFRSAWADAKKSGEWMADTPAFQPLSRSSRWAIRTQPRLDMLLGLVFLAIPVLLVIFLVVGLLIVVVVQGIDAWT
jgi:hypothetical protein